jgi:hypothetical protein
MGFDTRSTRMSNAESAKGLRERLAGGTEDRLGKAIIELFDNPLLNGALGRASDAREKAAQAQELAMGALNLPSAADVERLTRRLRSISQRLEGIEDGVHRIGRTLSGPSIETRLAAIEEQLRALSGKLDRSRETPASGAGRSGDASGASVSPIGPRFDRSRETLTSDEHPQFGQQRPVAKPVARKKAAAKKSAKPAR